MGTHGGPAIKITKAVGKRNLHNHLLWRYDVGTRKGISGTNIVNLANRKGNSAFTMGNSGMLDNSAERDKRLYWDGSGQRTGASGNSYHLNYNSNNDYKYYTSNPTQNTDGYTLTWWMCPDGRASHQNDGSGYGLWVGSGTIRHIEVRGLNYTTNNSAYFRTEAALQNGYSFGTSTIPGGLPNGVFAHFAISFENEGTRSVKWYKNGELFHTHANIATNNSGEYFNFYRIGSQTGSTSYLYAGSFKGWIPAAAAYDTNLTDNEIEKLYRITKSRYI